MSVARKSLIAAYAITKGEPFTVDNLAVKRPGNGLSPMKYWELLKKKTVHDISADELVEL